MSELVLEVYEREAIGKNANRRLRAVGELPAVVYGAGLAPATIRVEERKVKDILRSGRGENTVFLLRMHGTDQSRHAMIRELQDDPINGALIHIDFQRIQMDKKVKVAVHVELGGEAEGVKTEGGLVDFVTREIDIECLPGDIPAHIDLDVSALHVGQHVEAKELELPEGVELAMDPDRVIVSVSRKKVEVEEEEEKEEELIEAETEEPEVVQRGKAEETG